MYTRSSNIDKNKVFIVNRSDIEGRLDAEFYRPEILSLEHKVRAISSNKLRNYICRISSGATPSVKEEEKFYSNEENGIPFLRVQNLQTNSELSLEDVKYINRDTHLNYLRRSQVGEFDLLVKITGVGRMAIASVAPLGFVGNTNQHIAIIKTKDRSTSKYLANYLNLNFVELLASRRSTGGTRPALDYPALKSIPIIENIDFSPIENAEKIKQQKEIEAKALLDDIDDYLLKELGIVKPVQNNQLANRIFTILFSDLSGNKYGPIFHFNKSMKICGGIYTNFRLQDIASICKGQSITKEKISNGVYPVIAGGQTSPYKHSEYNNEGNCITISASGAYAGYVWYHRNAIFASDCSVVRTYDEQTIKTAFLFEVLKLKQSEVYLLQQGAGQPHVYPSDIAKLQIPVPPIKKQNEIINYISKIRNKAKALQMEAQNILDDAKRQVERGILGE